MDVLPAIADEFDAATQRGPVARLRESGRHQHQGQQAPARQYDMHVLPLYTISLHGVISVGGMHHYGEEDGTDARHADDAPRAADRRHANARSDSIRLRRLRPLWAVSPSR